VDYPAEPDYRDSTQWYITDRGAAADVFYIISTETGDYTMPTTKGLYINNGKKVVIK